MLLLYSPLLGLARFFSFLILYTVDWTPRTGDQPVATPTVQASYRTATVGGLDEEQETANCTQETNISRGEVRYFINTQVYSIWSGFLHLYVVNKKEFDYILYQPSLCNWSMFCIVRARRVSRWLYRSRHLVLDCEQLNLNPSTSLHPSSNKARSVCVRALWQQQPTLNCSMPSTLKWPAYCEE